MNIPIIAIVPLFLAVIILIVALNFLLRKVWLLGFIRGFFGFTLIIAGLILVAIAMDLANYHDFNIEQPLGHINFEQSSEQRFQVTVSDHAGTEYRFYLNGDLWQAEADLMHIKLPLFKQRSVDLIALSSFKSQYISLQDAKRLPITTYTMPLQFNNFGVKLSRWVTDYGFLEEYIAVDTDKSAFAPAQDGALYSLFFNNHGIVIVPINEKAEHALQQWQ